MEKKRVDQSFEPVIAALDRRVRLLESSTESGRQCRVSDLAAHARIVLLGEPGIGKSTVLAKVAAEDDAIPISVRTLLRDSPPESTNSLYIDALDQTRQLDTAEEHAVALGSALSQRKCDKWWLACRTEDWRGGADLAALEQDQQIGEICVVQLLALDHEEAVDVLRALNEPQPEAFLEHAVANGALAFTESPLMLSLLHRTVSSDRTWPKTRYALFERATRHLAREWDQDRRHVPRAGPEEILDAAGIISLLLLTTGTDELWRRYTSPPTGTDTRYLELESCRIPPRTLGSLLDSALMRGEGDSLAPFHRTTAEFLAARTLTARVIGEHGRAAYPLRRALALITGTDGVAVSELRGVHAWLGVHLWQRGKTEEARRLLEQDPTSALFYGDVAVFDTPARRTLLQALPRIDPYFRNVESEDSALAKLVGPDLVSDFREILERNNHDDHLAVTVLDALVSGPPVPTLYETLEQIVLDPGQPHGFRRRAIDARLRNDAEVVAVAQRLLADLASESISREREELRSVLVAALPLYAIDPALFADVLITYTEAERNDHLFGLSRLKIPALAKTWPEVLDALAERQPLPWTSLAWASDARDIILELFVKAVDADQDLRANRLVLWIFVLSPEEYQPVDTRATAAVDRWLDVDTDREIELFKAVRNFVQEKERWHADTYSRICGRDVSPSIAAHVLDDIDRAESPDKRQETLSAAVDLFSCAGYNALPDEWWALHDRLCNDRQCNVLLKDYILCAIDWYRIEVAHRRARRRREDTVTRRWDLRRIHRKLPEIRQGQQDDLASRGAQFYFFSDMAQGAEGAVRWLEKVRETYSDAIRDAMVDRWTTLARGDLVELGPRELGKAIGERSYRDVEIPTVAGVHLLLERGELMNRELSVSVSLCVLGRAFEFIRNDDAARDRIYRKAVRALCATPDSLLALRTYWISAIEADAKLLPGADGLKPERLGHKCDALSGMLIEWLETSPDLPSMALRDAFKLIVAHKDDVQLPALAQTALNNELSKESLETWLSLGLELDPTTFARHLDSRNDPEKLTTVLADYAMRELSTSFLHVSLTTRSEHALIVLEHLAQHVPVVREKSEDGVNTSAMQRRDAVNLAFSVLAADPDVEAARRLSALRDREKLAPWKARITHVLAQQSAARRDQMFRHPTPAAVCAALDGEAPVSAADLRAIVLEELESLSSSLHTGTTRPWIQFWNTNKNGNSTGVARVENVCRDRILERLADRLERYKIAGAIPEGARAEGTRADVLLLTGAGAALPVEVKRHNHPDLWTAASEQLQTYTSSPDTQGIGIYLVLWFGLEWKKVPSRPLKKSKPETAGELADALRADLPEFLQQTTDIVVFDVTKPE